MKKEKLNYVMPAGLPLQVDFENVICASAGGATDPGMIATGMSSHRYGAAAGNDVWK